MENGRWRTNGARNWQADSLHRGDGVSKVRRRVGRSRDVRHVDGNLSERSIVSMSGHTSYIRRILSVSRVSNMCIVGNVCNLMVVNIIIIVAVCNVSMVSICMRGFVYQMFKFHPEVRWIPV